MSTIARKSGIRAKFGQNEITLVINYDYEAPPDKIDALIGDNALHNWFSLLYPASYNFYKIDGFHIDFGQWYGALNKSLINYLNICINTLAVSRLFKKLEAKPREMHAHALSWLQYPRKTYTYNVMLIEDAA